MLNNLIPKAGVVYNAIGAFSEKGKQKAEARFRKLFNELIKEKAISADSFFLASPSSSFNSSIVFILAGTRRNAAAQCPLSK